MSAPTTFAEYAAIKAVNWSTLKEMGKSPLHYRHRLTTPRSDTPAMRFGRAVHCAVLEPDRFPLDWTVYDGRRAGKAWDEFAEVNAAKSILTATEYSTCLGVRDAVRAHKVAARILRRGRPEQTLQWVDPVTRIRCKARLDWLCGGSRGTAAITDLKTTGDVDGFAFGRLAARMGYGDQLAFYRLGLLATGHDLGPVRIIAVEAEPPHDVAVFTVDDDVLEVGAMKVRKLLHQVKTWRSRRRWPGRYPDEESLEYPEWALPASSDYTTTIKVLT